MQINTDVNELITKVGRYLLAFIRIKIFFLSFR
jgi:hypothetical protein